MKFFKSRPAAIESKPPESGWKDSGPPASTPEDVDAQERAESEAKFELRRQLLESVLARTLQKTRVPPQWIGGELNPMILPSGEEWIEIRLSVQVDEWRLLSYLTTFQAEFERRLLEADPHARKWLAGIAWKLAPDPVYELDLPPSDYWDRVTEDRELTARQKGALEWDPDSLARHFSDTNPSEADFENTHPPERDVEDIGRPAGDPAGEPPAPQR